jgi:hypothetical protein
MTSTTHVTERNRDMAILQPPKIDSVELTLEKDVANANFKVEFDINWSTGSRDGPERDARG